MAQGRKPAVQDVWFEKNFIAASGVQTLEEAVPQWEFSHFDSAEGVLQRCDVCPTNIRWIVVLRNMENGMYLRIGHICYDKMRIYLETKQLLPVSFSSRRDHGRTIRSYIIEKLGEYPDKKPRSFSSVTEWCKTQRDLPEQVTRALECIAAFGYTVNIADADAFVDYYKANRLFSLRELLTDAERRLLHVFPYKNSLPPNVTIAKLPKLRRLLARGNALAKKRQEKWHAAALKAWQAEKEMLASGINIAWNTELLQGDDAAVLYLTDPNHERSYRCVLPGWGMWNSRIHIGDVRATVPNSAKFQATDIVRPELPSIPRLLLHPDDKELWLARAEEYGRARIAQIFLETREIMECLVREHPERYVKGAFRKGVHPRNGNAEWHLRVGSEKFILQTGDVYREDEGEIYIRITKVIVPDAVYIVARMNLSTEDDRLGWFYNTYYTGVIWGGREVRFVRNFPTRHTVVMRDKE